MDQIRTRDEASRADAAALANARLMAASRALAQLEKVRDTDEDEDGTSSSPATGGSDQAKDAGAAKPKATTAKAGPGKAGPGKGGPGRASAGKASPANGEAATAGSGTGDDEVAGGARAGQATGKTTGKTTGKATASDTTTGSGGARGGGGRTSESSATAAARSGAKAALADATTEPARSARRPPPSPPKPPPTTDGPAAGSDPEHEVALIELRTSPLGAPLDHHGDRVLVFDDRVEVRDRADAVRQVLLGSDITDAAIHRKLTGTVLSIEAADGETIVVKGLRPEQADEALTLIHRHTRHGRPARSRNGSPTTAPAPTGVSRPAAAPDAAAEAAAARLAILSRHRLNEAELLGKLADLHRAGVLSDAEFEDKIALVGRLVSGEALVVS